MFLRYSLQFLFNRVILLSFVISLFGACTNSPNNDIYLKKTGSISNINIIGQQPLFFNEDISTNFKNDTLVFDYFSKLDSSIHFLKAKNNFRLDSKFPLGKFLLKIGYRNSDNIGYTIQLDTLFLAYSGILYTINIHNSNIISIFSLPRLETNEYNTVTCNMQVDNKLRILKNGEFMFGCYSYVTDNENKKTATFSPTIMYAKKEKNGLTISGFDAFLPSNYNDKYFYINNSNKLHIHDSITIINYYYSDSIEIINKNKYSQKRHLKSKYSNGFSPFNGNPNDITAVNKIFLRYPHYNNVNFDPINKYYIRSFLIQDSTFTEELTFYKYWSLSVFDADFNYLQEFVFKTKDYSPSQIFVSPLGKIYILNNSISKFEKNNNNYGFDIFEIGTK